MTVAPAACRQRTAEWASGSLHCSTGRSRRQLFARDVVDHLRKPVEVFDEQGAAVLLDQSEAREATEFPGDGLAMRADAAGDLCMGRSGVDARTIALARRRSCETQQLGLYAIVNCERAELVDAGGEQANAR